MKAPKFRLAAVLRIREIEERAAAVTAAQAREQAAAISGRAYAQREAAGRHGFQGSGSGDQLRGALVQAHVAAATAARTTREADQAQQYAQERATEWTRAAQRTKGLQRLEDRHRERVTQAANRAEERAVDDLVTRAFAVRATRGGDG